MVTVMCCIPRHVDWLETTCGRLIRECSWDYHTERRGGKEGGPNTDTSTNARFPVIQDPSLQLTRNSQVTPLNHTNCKKEEKEGKEKGERMRKRQKRIVSGTILNILHGLTNVNLRTESIEQSRANK